MKYIKYICLNLLLVSMIACNESDYLTFDTQSRVQLKVNTDKNRVNFFFEKDLSVVRDTFYMTVNLMGAPESFDRDIRFDQVTEYDITYTTDSRGNIIDTIYTEILNKAIPGVHYIPMDSPEMVKNLKMPANQITTQIPVIFLRDESLQTEEYRLCLKLVESKDFLLGEQNKLAQTIFVTDKLGQPSNWSRVKYYFGAYSVVKHSFMIDVVGVEINEAWISNIDLNYTDEVMAYKLLFVNSLRSFNNDPANIASGEAPLKDENGDFVAFPD